LTGTTRVLCSRSREISCGENIAPKTQTVTVTTNSADLIVRLIGEVNLIRAVKLVPCSRAFRLDYEEESAVRRRR
jgi:hypothetical protein